VNSVFTLTTVLPMKNLNDGLNAARYMLAGGNRVACSAQLLTYRPVSRYLQPEFGARLVLVESAPSDAAHLAVGPFFEVTDRQGFQERVGADQLLARGATGGVGRGHQGSGIGTVRA
jgi:hypothetical protein